MNNKSAIYNQDNESSEASILSTVWGFFKPVAKVAVIFQMFSTANADIACISINGTKLYRLTCYSYSNVVTILDSIKHICPHPQIGESMFCPPAYSPDYTVDGFGTGYFGGTVCFLRHKIDETSGCVIDIVKNNVTNGLFGSDVDILTTMGICFGGAVVVIGGVFLIPYLRDKIKLNAVVTANERSRLMNDDTSSTAPNELSIIIKK